MFKLLIIVAILFIVYVGYLAISGKKIPSNLDEWKQHGTELLEKGKQTGQDLIEKGKKELNKGD